MCYLSLLRGWQVFIFIIMANQINQEIILQDGKFYRRTVCETFLQTQEDALRNIDQSSLFYVSPFQPKENVYTAAFIGSNVSPNKQYFFREVDGFHFRGATLTKREDDTDYRMYVTNNTAWSLSEGMINVATNTFNGGQGLIWKPTGFRMFLMFEYLAQETGIRSMAPYIFMYHMENKKSYIPNLPNVFDRGQICTGDDFPSNDHTWSNLNDAQMNHLKTSFCNNDLRMNPNDEHKFVAFTSEGETVQRPESIPSKELNENQYYLQPTLEPITEFTKWLINT